MKKKTYRIKKIECFDYTEYIIQVKSIFGFWYSENSPTGCYYHSLESARNAIRRKTTDPTITIFYEN